MIRTILFAAIVLCSISVQAQAPLSLGGLYGGQSRFTHFNQLPDTNSLQKKWSLTKFVGLSSGFTAFNGGSATFLSAPVGLQLNRQLTNNVYAFAGVGLAPTYLHYNSAFFHPSLGKTNAFMTPNNFSTISTAQMGLMYINNDRTFSISGSIGVSRSHYNGYSPLYHPAAVPAITNNRH